MHIPDGFIDAPTSAVTGVIAGSGIALSLFKAGKDTLDARAPLTGLVAAFVFAAQMLNFPVASGTSGHLIGGFLAAVLVGPWLGALALAVVLVVQSLLFADGGVSALGLNIINMAFVPAFGGYALFWALRRILPATRRGVLASTAIGALISVVAASIAFTVEYAIGGNAAAPVTTVAAAMIGVHVLIGIGEAAISTLTVGAVLTTRPDLIYGARDLPRAIVATEAVPA